MLTAEFAQLSLQFSFPMEIPKQAEFYSPEIQGCGYAIDFSHFFKDFNLPNLMVILLPSLPSAFISVVGYSYFVADAKSTTTI